MAKDKIFEQIMDSIEVFEFDKKVAKVFPDMIARSVPGYNEVISLTGILADVYATNHSNIYDLGCSLGASSFAMRNFVQAKVELIAVDSSADMVQGCKQYLSQQQSAIDFQVLQQDLLTIAIDKASVVVMNFILQFINPEHRDKILRTVAQGLNPNGVLIIAEKIKFNNVKQQQNLTLWHEKFKQANGYSELEIEQKRTALESTLISDSENKLYSRLKNAGFSHVQTWFQALNFQAFIAIK